MALEQYPFQSNLLKENPVDKLKQN